MWDPSYVGANGIGAEDESGEAPAREKHSDDHDQRNDDWRDADGDELGGRFGGSEPGSGGEAAENAEELQAAVAGLS